MATMPLADVTLHFDVTVREVREATEEELATATSTVPATPSLMNEGTDKRLSVTSVLS